MQLRERKEILMLIWSMVDHCVNEIHKNSSIYAMTFVKHCLPKFGEYVHLILFSRQVEGIGFINKKEAINLASSEPLLRASS